MSALPLSAQVFSILSAIVAEYAGLQFDRDHIDIFADRAAARAADLGFESMLDYYYFLRYDPAGQEEMGRLVEALVIGETYFFRELPPLELAVTQFVVPRLGGATRPRIWCAACSTGEEPHTLAMLLASRGILDDVELVASDISTVALERARRGHFGRRALRQDVPSFAEPWLDVKDVKNGGGVSDGGGVKVRPSLTAAIDWRRVNLVDRQAVAALGTFDVVICRNVLIYFGDDTIRQVVNGLSAALRRGGALMVGISESLLRFDLPLVCQEQNGVFFYKKAT